MSADPRTIQVQEGGDCRNFRARPEGTKPEASPKPESGDTLPRETEKEKIKRQLYNLIDRVDKL